MLQPRLAEVRRRDYVLRSDWMVQAPRPLVWDVLADPTMTWPRWWPGLRAQDVVPAPGALVGSTAVLVMRAPWGYTLRIGLRVEEAEPGARVLTRVTGDLEGTGRITVADLPGAGTHIHVDWRVATVAAWMNLTAPLLAPAFAAAHGRVMAAGERGLRGYLDTGRASG